MTQETCRCSHVKSLHTPYGCRINGCRCDGFRDVLTTSEPEQEPTARRLVVEIPEGFYATISLYPITVDTDGS